VKRYKAECKRTNDRKASERRLATIPTDIFEATK